MCHILLLVTPHHTVIEIPKLLKDSTQDIKFSHEWLMLRSPSLDLFTMLGGFLVLLDLCTQFFSKISDKYQTSFLADIVLSFLTKDDSMKAFCVPGKINN